MTQDRYHRQTLFFEDGEDAQRRIADAGVLIVGCGALGTHAADLLARAGVGRLRLVDRDVVEWSNLHRQSGFTEADARAARPKADALAEHLSRVNSSVAIEPFADDFNWTNCRELAAGCTLILDGTDNLPARFLLNDLSLAERVPWVYAGAIGGEAHVQLFSGEGGPCLRCQMPELPPPGTLPTCDTSGVVGPAAAVAASWQAALALRFLAGGPGGRVAGEKALLSPWRNTARVVAVAADPACPTCVSGRREFLDGAGADRVTVLCGRGAVQVLPPPGTRGRLRLAELAGRLAPLGELEVRERFLRLRSTDVDATVFADGRAIFAGLTDRDRARTLYARYIGQ